MHPDYGVISRASANLIICTGGAFQNTTVATPK
jgi:hypothetical protein